MGYYPLRPLFPSGEILASPAVIEIGIDINRLLHRHLAGLWREDLCLKDSQSNERALAHGEAILSEYHVVSPDGQINSVIIMTESDRSYTVIFILGEPGFPSIEA